MKRLLAITAFILPFTSVAYAGPHGGKAKKPVAHTGNTGITGGMDVPDHRVPADKSTGNTGITGGMDVPNNRVPKARDTNKNTGITGGMDLPNNRVPKRRTSR